MGKMRTALGLGRADQRLIVEAAVALLVARLRSALPFRIVARQLGGIVAPHMSPTIPKLVPTPASVQASPADHNADNDAIHAVRWAIRMTAPSMPFRAVCLQQAIAARAMLDRRGIASVLHLGVGSPTGSALEAHAWLDAGGLWVTGYPVDPALTEVGRFVRRPSERSASARA